MRNLGQTIGAEIANMFTLRVMMALNVIAVVVALAGPFGTFSSQPLGWRLFYWLVVIWSSLPIAIAGRVFWHEVLASKPKWVEDFMVVLTMTFMFGPLLIGLNAWMRGQVEHPYLHWEITLVSTFLITLSVVVVENLLRFSGERLAAKSAAQQRDRLLERLDVGDAVRLAKISSDNHHVRIVTDDHVEHRILMRFRDAVAEIDIEKGICVHRSHWVALAQIDRIDVVDGKEIVYTRCGSAVPVGPKYRSQLVELGAIAA